MTHLLATSGPWRDATPGSNECKYRSATRELVQFRAHVRTIALVVLGNPRWPVLRLHMERVVAAVNAATPGSYTEVEIPKR